MKRLEEEIKTNSYMVRVKLPKELESMRRTVQYLQRVTSEPAMGQAEVQQLEDKVRTKDVVLVCEDYQITNENKIMKPAIVLFIPECSSVYIFTD